MTSQGDRKKAIRKYAKEHNIGYTAAKSHFDSQQALKSPLEDIISSVVSGEDMSQKTVFEISDGLVPISVYLQSVYIAGSGEVFAVTIKNGQSLPRTVRESLEENPGNADVEHRAFKSHLRKRIHRSDENGEPYGDAYIKRELLFLIENIRTVLVSTYVMLQGNISSRRDG